MRYIHNYTVLNYDKEYIEKWLIKLSILLPPFIVGILTVLTHNIGGLGWISSLAALITSSLIYFLLSFLFKKFFWKTPFLDYFINVPPNLNGDWELTGSTLNEDGSTKVSWLGSCSIEQDWNKIIIFIKTDNSESYSYTATLSKQAGKGCWELSYSYSNAPNISSNRELNPHKGFCEIDFNKELNKASGAYFNQRRRTFGSIEMEKK